MIYKAIVFLPLIGFLIAGLFGRQIGAKASEYVTTGSDDHRGRSVLDRLLQRRHEP